MSTPFTSATTAELQTSAPRAGTWKLELRTAWQDWLEFDYVGKQPHVTLSRDLPRTCTVTIPNAFDPATGLSLYADESDQTNYIQLEAEVRATALVMTASGLEAGVKFQGKIDAISLDDWFVTLTCSDWKSRATEVEANVSVTPTAYVCVPEGTRVPLGLVSHGAYGRVYSVASADVPDAFSDDLTRRRSWVDNGVIVWFHATLTHDDDHPTFQVPSAHYKVNIESGTLTLYEPSHTVFDFPTDSTLRLPGDQTAYFVSGYQFEIVEGDNAGSYSLSLDSVFDGSAYTTLTVSGTPFATSPVLKGSVYRGSFWIENLAVSLETGGHASHGPDGAVVGVNCDLARVYEQAVTTPQPLGLELTSAEYDLPDLGIDLGAPFSFRGKFSDLLSKIETDFQANIKFRYDPGAVRSGTYPDWETGQFTLRLIVQPETPDFTLYSPLTISQPRSNRDLATCIVAQGDSELRINALVDSVIKDNTTGGEYRYINGTEVGRGEARPGGKTLPLLVNGIDQLACLVHNLPSAADIDPGGSKYAGWYEFVVCDLGVVDTWDFFRAVLPPTRNENAANGDQRIADGGDAVGFWPGLWVQGSVDGSTKWTNLAPALKGYFQPGSEIKLDDTQLTFRTFRYLRVRCAAYKYGISDQADPSIGLGEIELSNNNKYRVEKFILSEAGSYYYTSDIALAQPVDRNYPDALGARGGVFRVKYLDLSGRWNEFMAHDVALQEYEESLRLYEIPNFTGLTDPRLDAYDGVRIVDGLNGSVDVLAEDIEWADHQTRLTGTNYRPGVWKVSA